MTTTRVTIGTAARRRRTNLTKALQSVTVFDAFEDPTPRNYRNWRDLGGPRTRQPLLTEPSHQAKAAKSTRPEYVMHLAPHRVADGVSTVCPWSTAGCRAACLYSAGHGQRRTVQRGRIARTRFAASDPVGFLRVLNRDFRRLERRHFADGVAPLVRLNATSDIAWEAVPAVAQMMRRYRFRFADYTKASPEQRPRPIDRPMQPLPYTLARSVWPDRHSVADVVDLWRAGHHVSAVVDEPWRLMGYAPFVDASATDEWLLSTNPAIGALERLGAATKADAFSAHELLEEVNR